MGLHGLVRNGSQDGRRIAFGDKDRKALARCVTGRTVIGDSNSHRVFNAALDLGGCPAEQAPNGIEGNARWRTRVQSIGQNLGRNIRVKTENVESERLAL